MVACLPGHARKKINCMIASAKLYDGNPVMSSYNANIEVTRWLIALLPSYNLSFLLVGRQTKRVV